MIKLTLHKQTTESAPTLVLLHAFPFSSAMWHGLIDRLSDLQIGVATIDLPGFGGTPNHEWDMQQASSWLHDSLIRENIQRPVLCGLSMGGYLALAYAKLHPDALAGLILADTKSAADPDNVKQDREAFAQDALKRGAIASIERNLLKMTSDQTQKNLPKVAGQIKAWMKAADPQGIANALRAMAKREDTTERLRSLRVPVLLIVGEEDVVTPPSEMEKMKAVLTDAKLVKIAGAAHMSVNEKPDEFATAMRDYLHTLKTSL
jgi:pimeloyl-ACP methyl ester carboxylesterase